MRLTNVKFYCLFAHMWRHVSQNEHSMINPKLQILTIPQLKLGSPMLHEVDMYKQVLVNLEKTSEKVPTWVKGKATF